MLIILPDPTTRRCPKHRDELMTDSVQCLKCAGDELIERLRGHFKAVLSLKEQPQ